MVMQIEPNPPFIRVEQARGMTHRLLERLYVVQRSPSDLSAAEALDQLVKAGLACSQLRGKRLRIVGGASSFMASGIQGYEDSFAIIHESNGNFSVFIAGARSFDDEEGVASRLADAVELVIRTYIGRGMIAPSE